MTDARDTFSVNSDVYAAARPSYPAALYDWILSHCAGRETAWDCATGTGQAALALSPHFDTVHASDISSPQITHAEARPNIVYQLQHAEKTDFPDGIFDLVTVAQALHWFDYSRFWDEVVRVSKPQAFFCAWGYSWFECDPAVQELLAKPILGLIEDYWAPNNGILWRGLQDSEIRSPFDRVEAPPLSIDVSWTLPQLVAYLKTWSAYKRAAEDPFVAEKLDATIARALMIRPPDEPLDISMPLVVAAGYVTGTSVHI